MSCKKNISSGVYPSFYKTTVHKRLTAKESNSELSLHNSAIIKKAGTKFDSPYGGRRVDKGYKNISKRFINKSLNHADVNEYDFSKEIRNFLKIEGERMLVHGKINGQMRVLSKPERKHGYLGFRCPRGQLSPRLLNFMDAQLIKTQKEDLRAEKLSEEFVEDSFDVMKDTRCQVNRNDKEICLHESLKSNLLIDYPFWLSTTLESVKKFNHSSNLNTTTSNGNFTKIDGLRYVSTQTIMKTQMMLVGVPKPTLEASISNFRNENSRSLHSIGNSGTLTVIKQMIQNSKLKDVEFLDDKSTSQPRLVTKDCLGGLFNLMASKIGTMFEYLIIKTNQQTLFQLIQMLDQITI